MASNSPYVLQWGILATGGIAETFTKDLLTNPLVRDVSDIRHQVVAVASSSSIDRAADFIKRVNGPSQASCYGCYAELVADPKVDIVYVSTPHSHHFQNAMLALTAGKHVLCEKALTVTGAQARVLVETARANKVFLMEAVWTRFFPLSVQARQLVASGAIGTVIRTIADFSFNNHGQDGKIDLDPSDRLVNRHLAGGALLDLGVYSMHWVFQTLFHLQPEAEKEKPVVTAAMNQYDSGVDETTAIICQFPRHKSMGIAMTTMRVATDPDGHNKSGPCIRIQGSAGEIQFIGSAARPLELRLLKKGVDEVEVVKASFPKDPERDGWGHGMYWEADECARCVRDGKLESSVMPLDESVVLMDAMEEALRQGGVVFPEGISSCEFSATDALNMPRS